TSCPNVVETVCFDELAGRSGLGISASHKHYGSSFILLLATAALWKNQMTWRTQPKYCGSAPSAQPFGGQVSESGSAPQLFEAAASAGSLLRYFCTRTGSSGCLR